MTTTPIKDAMAMSAKEFAEALKELDRRISAEQLAAQDKRYLEQLGVKFGDSRGGNKNAGRT